MAQHLETMNATDLGEPGTSSPGLLQIAWRHKTLVVFGVLVALVLGTLYFAQAAPLYESEAQVLVVKKRPDVLPVAGNGLGATPSEDFIPTHQGILKSALIVNDAVQKAKLHSLDSFKDTKRVTERILKRLKATRSGKKGALTNIIDVSFRANDPQDAATVLNAVLDSYQNFLEATYKSGSEEAVKLLADARNVLERQFAKQKEEYLAFRHKYPLLSRGKEGTTLLQDRFLTLDLKRASVLLHQADVEARLGSITGAIKAGRDRGEILALVGQSIRTDRMRMWQEDRVGAGGQQETEELSIQALQMQEHKLLQDYGPKHPEVLAVRKRLEYLRAYNEVFNKLDIASKDPITAHVKSLQSELETLRASVQKIRDLFNVELEAAKPDLTHEVEDDMLRRELDRTQLLFDTIVKRLQDVDMVKELGGYEARVIAAPEEGQLAAPKPLIVFGVAVLAGLLLGFGLAYLAELSDQNFRSPEEIRRRLGLPLVGTVPFFREAQAAPDADAEELTVAPSVCAYHRPKSRQAEAYRAVRTALYFSVRTGGYKVVQVTSPDMGEGKSTLASNLAVTIAQSEKKVILIDADLRRPSLHKLFGLSPEQGLTSVLAGDAELDDVIQATAVPGLSVLPCGPIPPNPAELLTLSRFQELLGALREKYDFVVVDTPPLLAVTDPSVVVPYADTVLFTLHPSKRARPHAERAVELLGSLGANVMGVVVNSVDERGSTYGNYGGGYGYYNYRQNSGYYAENSDSSSHDDGKNGAAGPNGSAARNGSNGHASPNGSGAADGGRGTRTRTPSRKRRPGHFWDWLFR
jgi:capsular exopolysaccharide synthesis family protein